LIHLAESVYIHNSCDCSYADGCGRLAVLSKTDINKQYNNSFEEFIILL